MNALSTCTYRSRLQPMLQFEGNDMGRVKRYLNEEMQPTLSLSILSKWRRHEELTKGAVLLEELEFSMFDRKK